MLSSLVEKKEKRMVKVLKALAEYYDISLGDLLEGITLHAFEEWAALPLLERGGDAAAPTGTSQGLEHLLY